VGPETLEIVLEETVQALVGDVAGLAEIEGAVFGVEFGELRRDRAVVVGAGAPGSRAPEEGDGALGGDAVVVPGPAHAALVQLDRLAGEWRPAPAVVGDVLGLFQAVVLGEVLLGPRRAAVVRQQVG